MEIQKSNYNSSYGLLHSLGIHHFKTRIYSKLAGVPEELEGYTIIQLSDLHIDENNIRNPNEKERIKYGHEITGQLRYYGRDLEKTMLMITGDIPNTDSHKYQKGETLETPIEYIQQVLPYLDYFPGNQKYIVRGNHDHEHTGFTAIRNYFTSKGYRDLNHNPLTIQPEIILNDKLNSAITCETISIKNKKIGIIGLPDYIHQAKHFTPAMYDNLKELVRSYDYSVIMIHNLDGIDGKWVNTLGNDYGLSALRNCLILSGHTHWYHINYPIIGQAINKYSKLYFQSKHYQGHKELPNNVTLINNPGMGNPIGAPLRINATGGASIIFL